MRFTSFQVVGTWARLRESIFSAFRISGFSEYDCYIFNLLEESSLTCRVFQGTRGRDFESKTAGVLRNVRLLGPARPEGWHKSTFLDVGDIFDVLVTADQNIQYQRNLSGRRIALVVLNTNHWGVIRLETDRVREAIGAAVAGACLTLPFDRLPLVRRLWPGYEA